MTSRRVCPVCRAPLVPAARRCPACGHRLPGESPLRGRLLGIASPPPSPPVPPAARPHGPAFPAPRALLEVLGVEHLVGTVSNEPASVPLGGRTVGLGGFAGALLLLLILAPFVLVSLVAAFLPLIVLLALAAWVLGSRLSTGAALLGGLLRRPKPAAPPPSRRRFRLRSDDGGVVEAVMHRDRAGIDLGDRVEVRGFRRRGRLHVLWLRNRDTGVTDLEDGVIPGAIALAIVLLFLLAGLSS
jgi:hypothetical protein